MMRFLDNLSSSETHEGLPWEIDVSFPEKIRGDKTARDDWANRPSTKGCFYSGWEGVNPNLRITSKKGGENPPLLWRYLILDIDSAATDEQIDQKLRRLPWTARYVERTLTPGFWRAIYEFEEPIKVASFEMAKHILNKFKIDAKLSAVSGFDAPAFVNPTRYWTSSGDFRKISDEKIPANETIGKVISYLRDYKWKEFASTTCAMPIEAIRERLAEVHPGWDNQWVGDFEFEAQGPTFWISESTSPKSAIVKEGGIYTFSAHAPKPFYTWSELLGADFVKRFEEARMGDAVSGIYRSDRAYYQKQADGDWKPMRTEDVSRYLRGSLGISDNRGGGAASAVDQALLYIQQNNWVTGAANYVGLPDGVLTIDGHRVLNICTTRVMEPAGEPGSAIWGPGGKFPMVSRWLDGFYDPAEQIDYWMSWLNRFYGSFYRMRPLGGQIVQIMGGKDIGKTCLTQGLLPRMFSGSRECKHYILGQDMFNAELFKVALWTIDDGSIDSDARTRKVFTEGMKRIAANSRHRQRAMYECATLVDWMGRVIQTSNTDPESLRSAALDTDRTVWDKLMLFRGAEKSDFPFPPRDEWEDILDRETPHFCRYVLDYEIPPHCKGTRERYGVVSYKEDSLVQIAEQSSTTNTFAEVITAWKAIYFGENPKETYWEGTAFDLSAELASNVLAFVGAREYNLRRIPVELEKLERRDSLVQSSFTTEGRIWRILKSHDQSDQVTAPRQKRGKKVDFKK